MRRLAAIALPLVAVLLLAIWRAQGPAPQPPNAPAHRFSSARALGILQSLLAEGVPHPMATPANARIRDRIVMRFRLLGYETSIQRGFACNARLECGQVENILARVAGETRPAVLLVAHYDSVGAGPGASDDGVGVASLLEIARIVRRESHRNPIAFLITDGEEGGLLGAEAFAADAALMRSAGAVINVENRGTYGTSNMFETSRNNRWLIRRLARALERPQATSFFYAIYNLLPNDTDVTVFKRDGKASVNFAAIGGVNWYHTPFDDVAHVSARTLQHHGDNLLATARVFADSDLDVRSGDDASYFDILGFAMVWWPAGATLWVAIASLLLLMFAARTTNPRAMTFGVLATFTAILLSLLGGMAVSWLARLRNEGINWVAQPHASIAAMWLIGIAAALCSAALFRRRSEERAMLFGAAIVWHMIAIALAVQLTGAAFVFLVPGLAVTICALARARETTMSAIAATIAAIVIFPMGVVFYDALGGRLMIAITLLIGTAFTLAAPLFARFRYAALFAILALICALIAIALPPYSRERPRQVSLAYVDDSAAAPMWWTSNATPSLERAARFSLASPALTPWNPGRQWTAPARREPIPRVEVHGSREGNRFTVRVRSLRKANRLGLRFRGGTVVRVNGIPPAPRPIRFRDPVVHGWHSVIANGVQEMIVEIDARAPLDVVASDMTYGLPASGAPLARARDTSPAIPAHEGDVTITRVRTRL